jgi:putative ABC transport system permease protein
VQRLFGIPVDGLLVALVAALGIAVALVAALALRNRVLLRVGLRHLARQRGRTALIVVGLMLGTAIVSSALSTGDTMGLTIRSLAVESMGNTDELVSVRGATSQGWSGVGYMDERLAAAVEHEAAKEPLVDGVAPAIVEPVAVQDVTSRRSEPRVTLFASDPTALSRFGTMRRDDGTRVSLGDLGPGEAFLTPDGARELGARAGDELRVLVAGRAAALRVAGIVDYDGTLHPPDDDAAMMVPLAGAQEILGREGRVKHVLVSNGGDELSGVRHSDAVVAALAPALSRMGLEIDPTKKDVLDAADEVGNAFMSMFTTFGTFSIVAGFLLIFLIFVMLAAERRTEMGIARAVGTRRGQLVQLFLFEGLAYDLIAAAVGAALGVAISYGMVLLLADALGRTGLEIHHAVRLQSIVIAYALGVLLTFAVVALSAWRVSRLRIVAAIRALPEPSLPRRRRFRVLIGCAAVASGAALTAAGVSAQHLTIFGLGVSVAIVGLVPIARALGASERLSYTVAGLAIVAWWLLPFGTFDALMPDRSIDFSAFIVGGLIVVVGATWVIVYNADLVLGGLQSLLGRVRGLTPALRMAVAYPLRSRFRTGVTLAMFTLVVFTLVVGSTANLSFRNAMNDVAAYGGGFDIRATTPPVSPIADADAAVRAAASRAGPVRVVGSASEVGIQARQIGTRRGFEDYTIRGVDGGFLRSTTYEMALVAEGYRSSRDVWRALATRPGLAVVDSYPVPRRANWGFGGPPQDFRLEGLFMEDKTFAPIPVELRDPESGRSRRLTIVGVLKDAAPLFMVGLTTSQRTAAALLGDRARPSVHFLGLAPGADAGRVAASLESAFLANGLEADVLADELDDLMATNTVFTRLIQGFMGLGLIVGAAALGVVAARAVVERRQQIGVLRAIGYPRGTVRLLFVLESAFVSLTSIIVGTALGLLIALNVVRDSASQPSWEGLSFVVPWIELAVVFGVVLTVALGTSLAPAVRASRVLPAEALRYE